MLLNQLFHSAAVRVVAVAALAALSACGGKDEPPAQPEPVSDSEAAAPAAEPVVPAAPSTTAVVSTPVTGEPAAPAPDAAAPQPDSATDTPTPAPSPAGSTAGADAMGARIQTARANTAAPTARQKVLPVDAAKRDRAAAAYRDRLMQAIERKDVNALTAALAPDIKVGFGGASGPQALVKELNLSDPNSAGWLQLRDAVRLGWASDPEAGGEDMYYAPYLFKTFPENLDPSQYGAITGEKVNIRKEPNAKAEVVDTVTYEVVKVERQPNAPTETIGNETYPWVKVTLPDGKTGYVFGKYVRTPMDYRAGFKKVDGEWKMAFFAAGD